MVEWVQFDESETLSGMAYVAESLAHLTQAHDWLRRVAGG